MFQGIKSFITSLLSPTKTEKSENDDPIQNDSFQKSPLKENRNNRVTFNNNESVNLNRSARSRRQTMYDYDSQIYNDQEKNDTFNRPPKNRNTSSKPFAEQNSITRYEDNEYNLNDSSAGIFPKKPKIDSQNFEFSSNKYEITNRSFQTPPSQRHRSRSFQPNPSNSDRKYLVSPSPQAKDIIKRLNEMAERSYNTSYSTNKSNKPQPKHVTKIFSMPANYKTQNRYMVGKAKLRDNRQQSSSKLSKSQETNVDSSKFKFNVKPLSVDEYMNKSYNPQDSLWKCQICAFKNQESADKCVACDIIRPGKASNSSKPLFVSDTNKTENKTPKTTTETQTTEEKKDTKPFDLDAKPLSKIVEESKTNTPVSNFNTSTLPVTTDKDKKEETSSNKPAFSFTAPINATSQAFNFTGVKSTPKTEEVEKSEKKEENKFSFNPPTKKESPAFSFTAPKTTLSGEQPADKKTEPSKFSFPTSTDRPIEKPAAPVEIKTLATPETKDTGRIVAAKPLAQMFADDDEPVKPFMFQTIKDKKEETESKPVFTAPTTNIFGTSQSTVEKPSTDTTPKFSFNLKTDASATTTSDKTNLFSFASTATTNESKPETEEKPSFVFNSKPVVEDSPIKAGSIFKSFEQKKSDEAPKFSFSADKPADSNKPNLFSFNSSPASVSQKPPSQPAFSLFGQSEKPEAKQNLFSFEKRSNATEDTPKPFSFTQTDTTPSQPAQANIFSNVFSNASNSQSNATPSTNLFNMSNNSTQNTNNASSSPFVFNPSGQTSDNNNSTDQSNSPFGNTNQRVIKKAFRRM